MSKYNFNYSSKKKFQNKKVEKKILNKKKNLKNNGRQHFNIK